MKVYILLAEGFETIEALTPVDVFHRAGVDVETVSIGKSLEVMSSHGVRVQADSLLADRDLADGDALILPGGNPGYKNLAASGTVGAIAKSYFDSGRLLGAICGAPTILERYQIGMGLKVTCHHSVKDGIPSFCYTGRDVEHERNLVTAIGAGHSIDFALELLGTLQGQDAVERVKHGMELK